MPKTGREILLVDDEKTADNVIKDVQTRIDVEGIATVADYKVAAGKAHSRIDQEYGWDKNNPPDNAYWKKTAYGYQIHMPKAVLLT